MHCNIQYIILYSTSLPRLDTLREQTCLRWAIKNQLNPQHAHLFPLTQRKTRTSKKFEEQFCRGSKLYKSAVPSMQRALNKYYLKEGDSVTIVTKSGVSFTV